ncbi:MAG: hypothetical protein SW833_07265 [Cyanobacteriota bacterium]|nr:hypothetical protein [Cyanobacteriota bacterium]
MSILPNNPENASRTLHQQLSDCATRVLAMHSFACVLHSAVLHEQTKFLYIAHEIPYHDVLKYMQEELLGILDAVEEVQNALDPELRDLRSNR